MYRQESSVLASSCHWNKIPSAKLTGRVPGAGQASADQDDPQGTWRVRALGAGAVLVLTERNGAVTSHALSYLAKIPI